MRIVITTGLFPPDVGGPATHAADLAAELTARHHDVTVLTLGGHGRTVEQPGLVSFPRRAPWPVRSAQGVAWLVRNRRRYDAIYATGLPLVAVPGGRLARRPVVLKVVGDLAWERARQAGSTSLAFADFQAQRRVAPRLQAKRWARNWLVRHATEVLTPSESLRPWVQRWAPGHDVVVVPNGVRLPPGPTDRRAASARDTSRLRLVFAGRLVALKRVDLVLDAVARVPAVELDIVGDGPEMAALEGQAGALGIGDRVTFTGALPHDAALDRLAGADALVMASVHEGLPHTAIEALACGTPVLSAAAAGLLEVISHELNGLVVDPMTATSLAAAVVRLRDDAGLRRSLRDGAAATADDWRFERTADAIVDALERVTRRKRLPRVVFFGKSRMSDPPSPVVLAKFALHGRYFDAVTICTGPGGRRTIAGVRTLSIPAVRPAVLGRLLFYALGPAVAVAHAVGRRPSAVACQSPFEAVGVLLAVKLVPRAFRPRVQVELHGDWRTGSRLYGSPARRLVAPLADRSAAWAVRHATQVRAIGEFTEKLAREVGYEGTVERYPTFSDYNEFLSRPLAPLPEQPRALFIGVLERPKAIDVLLDAWENVHAKLPDASLVIVGSGSMATWLERRKKDPGLGESVETMAPVPQAELVKLLDTSTCLVVPSRSEGLGRVAIEAMARGRAVVAARTGGLGETVLDGVNGRLVPPEDVVALSWALVDVLSDRSQAAILGAAGRRHIEQRQPADEYEAGIQRLARWLTA